MNVYRDKALGRLILFCPTLNCRVASFVGAMQSEGKVCPGCGAEGIALNEVHRSGVGVPQPKTEGGPE